MSETFYEHAFGVEVGDTEGALYEVHAFLPAPFFYGLQQGGGDAGVVDKVDVAEAYGTGAPALIGAVVDDAGYAAHDAAGAVVGDEGLHVGKFQSAVFPRVEGGAHVGLQFGHGVRTVSVEPGSELDEVVQSAATCGFLDYDGLIHAGKGNGIVQRGQNFFT